MPANVVKTDRDEHLWNKAKEQAKEQGRENDWAYVMGIFQRMKGEKSMEKSLVAPMYRGARVPGQVPTREAMEYIRLANEPPRPWTTARLLAQDDAPRASVEAIVKGLGFNAQGEKFWKSRISDIIQGSKNEITFKQRLAGMLVSERLDPVLRKAIFDRSLRFWRDSMAKSVVEVVTVDELLEKAEPRGGTYHKRIPRKGGGYTYVYDPEKYSSRKDAHVDGKEALKSSLSNKVMRRLKRAGKNGVSPRELGDLVKKHGTKAIAEALDGHHKKDNIEVRDPETGGPDQIDKAVSRKNRFTVKNGALRINLEVHPPSSDAPAQNQKQQIPGSGDSDASGYKPKI
jgi:hypothetical protein